MYTIERFFIKLCFFVCRKETPCIEELLKGCTEKYRFVIELALFFNFTNTGIAIPEPENVNVFNNYIYVMFTGEQ
jgi:hypothetical protein